MKTMRKMVLGLIVGGFMSLAVTGLAGCRHDLDEDARVSSPLRSAK